MFSIIISSFLLHTFPPLNTKRSNINRNANVKAIHYRSEDIRVDSQRSSPRADSLSRLIREFDSSVRKKHKNGSVWMKGSDLNKLVPGFFFCCWKIKSKVKWISEVCAIVESAEVCTGNSMLANGIISSLCEIHYFLKFSLDIVGKGQVLSIACEGDDNARVSVINNWL